MVGIGSSEQVEGFSCITLFLSISLSTATKTFIAVLGRGKVSKDRDSRTFSITRFRANLMFVILSLKNATNSSHFDVEVMKELFGTGFMCLSIVEKSILGLL